MKRLSYYIPEKPTQRWQMLFRLIGKREWPVWVFPRIIQIQTISGCNARCIFCPSGRTKGSLPKGTMDWELYRRIIDECVSYRMWRISPYLMNEPLLDPEIGKRIGYITDRKRFPTYTKINTNASLLSEEAANQILESGLDILTCSVHGIVKEKYDRTMVGLQLEEVLANVDRFLDMKARMKKKKPELRVTMIRTKLIEPDIQQIKGYWKARGVKVSIRPMTNRADKRISALKISSSPLAPFDWCVRIMRQAYVNVRGQVLLCCNDWEQSTVLGDLTKQSLQEVWNGEVFQAIRRRFLQRDWKGLPCAACLIPKEHGGW